ncbi:N-acetylmuramoyl-L-alanine amidase CwlD [Rossellomorea vietnamensis]|uniref:N-acetylmuramoyl-L-alanine amidase CwlD n=1 Tax=Rossellomorea vietnamensis TaxID=218284 RepID=A0A5D4K6X8_9BACI|nr:N-acetylmuramoyl-L-alanine amidase CwlD [Rossellomorea vietnamensis]TYR73101.1 N-acetylmuramoyl-L-alanine amidase CwlD [Rossellomorea vietnamensis]
MNNKLKMIGFAGVVIILFFIFQYKLLDTNTWESWNLPLSGKIIYLDPGHGGADGGADSGEGNAKVYEKDIAFNVAVMLRDYFQEQGALVILTREEDRDLAPEGMKGYSRRKTEDLKKRLDLINSSNADLYLSIHLNSIPSGRWSGAQTFYNPKFKENKEVATSIQSELIRNLENTKREAKGIQNVYLVKHINKPGALVEIGFLSNPGEKANLMTEKYQQKVAASIYEGVLKYYDEKTDEE